MVQVLVIVAGVQLAEDLDHVEHVEFPFSTTFPPGSLRDLTRLPRLRSATFADTNLDDAGLAELARVVTLENLNLQSTGISNEGIAQLAALPRLSHLRLKANRQLDDRCARHLVALRGLVDLQLHETSIGQAGLDQLVALPTLVFLVIDDSNVTLEPVRALSVRMPNCAILIKGHGQIVAGELDAGFRNPDW